MKKFIFLIGGLLLFSYITAQDETSKKDSIADECVGNALYAHNSAYLELIYCIEKSKKDSIECMNDYIQALRDSQKMLGSCGAKEHREEVKPRGLTPEEAKRFVEAQESLIASILLYIENPSVKTWNEWVYKNEEIGILGNYLLNN